MSKAVDAVIIDTDAPEGTRIIGAARSSTTPPANTPDTPGTPHRRQRCKNNCGWTANQRHETCCPQCRGRFGPHSRDCFLKNKRDIQHRKHDMRGNDCDVQLEEYEDKQKKAFGEVITQECGRSMMESMKVLVDADWLIGIEEVEGNIYRAFAFGSFPEPIFAIRTTEGETFWSGVAANGKVLGAATIWIVQIMGPMSIIGSYVRKWLDDDTDVPDMKEYPGTKLLGLALVIMFNVNAYFEVRREAIAYAKIDVMYSKFGREMFGPHSGKILLLGECTNCYVFVTSCICSCLLLSFADNPQDVLFDALGILFLYNLDNTSNGLTFISDDDWPGYRLAWLYDQVYDETLVRRDRTKYLYRTTELIILALSWILPIVFVYSAC